MKYSGENPGQMSLDDIGQKPEDFKVSDKGEPTDKTLDKPVVEVKVNQEADEISKITERLKVLEQELEILIDKDSHYVEGRILRLRKEKEELEERLKSLQS